MIIRKILTASILTASVLTLAACSTTHSDSDTNGRGPGSGYGSEAGVTANGIGEGTNFDAQGNDPMKVGNQTYFFDFDKNEVHESDMSSLKVQADYLATHPQARILLTGNTDNRGSREYNIGLGERRTTSVESVLEADGVRKSQITTVSYGAEKPLATGNDEEAYAQNRRVELIYRTTLR